MSAQAFNRIAALEAQMRALIERIEKLEQDKTQACEERPHTLSLRKKADPSHA